MTSVERAREYVGIFIGAGDRWRDCVPVDGRLNGDSVEIGGVKVTHEGGGVWSLAAPGRDVVRLKRGGRG
jgi:hypothetical protein